MIAETESPKLRGHFVARRNGHRRPHERPARHDQDGDAVPSRAVGDGVAFGRGRRRDSSRSANAVVFAEEEPISYFL